MYTHDELAKLQKDQVIYEYYEAVSHKDFALADRILAANPDINKELRERGQ